MKTKAEALANPIVGDIWKTKRTHRTLRWPQRGGWALMTVSPGRVDCFEILTDTHFRRWASGAEYLGKK